MAVKRKVRERAPIFEGMIDQRIKTWEDEQDLYDSEPPGEFYYREQYWRGLWVYLEMVTDRTRP